MWVHRRFPSPRFKTALLDPCLCHAWRLLSQWSWLCGTSWTPASLGATLPAPLHGQHQSGWGGGGPLPLPGPPSDLLIASPSPVPLNRGWRCRRSDVLLCIVILRGLPRVISGISPHTKLLLLPCRCPWAALQRSVSLGPVMLTARSVF